jgi:very-short-patch-repair endonuclease
MEAPRQTIERARDLRRSLTLPEGLLWTRLRGRRLADLRFRRQHPVGPYILDFYCDEVRMAVEVDGQSHAHPDRIAHDERRTSWLSEQNITVVRLPARLVLSDMEGALDFIRRSAGR